MYHMKNIVTQEQPLLLAKCMYHIRNPIEECLKEETDLNICDQVMKFLKKMPNSQMIELEGRQDKLLQKLDNLYEKIKNISVLCNINLENNKIKKNAMDFAIPEEVVVVLNPNVLPWFLNRFLKEISFLNVSWHVHSSVSTDKIPKIEAFFRKYQDLYKVQPSAMVNLRLIFKSESTTPELKFSSLDLPILGTVNIIRYLCLSYSNIVPYDDSDHELESKLDSVYQLETASEKNKGYFISKIFLQSKEWICQDKFTIVDLAAFSVVNQLQNGIKYVPKNWFNNCEKFVL